MLNFLQEYQVQFSRTQLFCKHLIELELLEPMHARFTLSSGKKGALTGFKTVSRDKLKTLSGKQLKALVQTDELELVFAHLQSMNNLAGMLERAGAEKPVGKEISE